MFFTNKYGIDWKNDIQEVRMLKVLRKSGEIGVFKLIELTKIAHHTAIIKKLRDSGYNIKQRSEYTDHIHKSYYKLIEDNE